MREQYTNLYEHLREVTKMAEKQYKEEQKQLLEDNWISIKNTMEAAAKQRLTHISINNINAIPILRENYEEIIRRLKTLGFEDKNIKITKHYDTVTSIEISWGDEEI